MQTTDTSLKVPTEVSFKNTNVSDKEG